MNYENTKISLDIGHNVSSCPNPVVALRTISLCKQHN